MNKQTENRIRNQSLKFSENFLSQKSFAPDFIRIKLKKQWENFLFHYKNNKRNLRELRSSKSKGAKLFFSPLVPPLWGPTGEWGKKEKFCEYNYLILAKLVNFLGATQILQNTVRLLVKIHTKHLELEKLFQLKLTNNSIFFCWISFILREQLYQFVKLYSSFLCKSNFSPIKKKLEIQNKGRSFLFLNCSDFLTLKWYQNKIYAWSCHCFAPQNKEKLNKNYNRFAPLAACRHPLKWPNQKNTIFYSKNKTICYSQDETKYNIHQKLLIKTCFAGAKRFCKLSKQRYFRLIKKVFYKNKITTQIQLIQILNEIIGNWDTLVINTLTKRKSIKLNLILYQLLWRWGLARHKQQRARWIKNRYWHQKLFTTGAKL